MVFCKPARNKKVILLILISLLSCIFLSSMVQANEHFQLEETWKMPEDFLGKIFYSIIDNDAHIVGALYKTGIIMITRDKTILFSPFGQGPNEMMDVRAIFYIGNELASVENAGRIKLFQKKEGSYEYKRSIWLESKISFYIITNGLFYDSKIFLAGFEKLDFEKKENKAALLKVYNEEGAVLKNLIITEIKKNQRNYMMDRFVMAHNDKIYFISEDNLFVYIISADTLEEVDQIQLEIPDFYKPKPEDFYFHEGAYKSPNEFLLDNDYWKTSYSIITKALINEGYLVIQIRTCDKNREKFAVLFYSADSFKLNKVLFIDDLLLGAKKDKDYFYAKGDPKLDEEADNPEIHVFSLQR